MKAKVFVKAWKKFLEHPDPEKPKHTFIDCGESWRDAWNEEMRPWTPRVIGEAHATSTGSPLGDYLLKFPGESNWRYRTEEWKVDLVLAREGSNLPIPAHWKKGERDREAEWNKLFWPSTYEVIVEHENSCGISYEEMAKLILLRARLKVLITYTYDKGHGRSEELIKETRDQFKAMIKMAHKDLPESNEVEYLLIIGRLKGTGDEAAPEWYSSIISPKGEVLFEDPLPADK